MYPKLATDPPDLRVRRGARPRRQRWRLTRPWIGLVLASLFAACGEEEAGCTLVEEIDGSFLICAGERIPLHQHSAEILEAAVEGEVRLFGREDHAGIEILLAPTEDGRSFRTRTDSTGAFRFEGVPVGRYHLRARAPSYQEGLLIQQLVLGPTTRLEALVLRSAIRLHSASCEELVAAPSGDAFACLRHAGGPLMLWEGGASLEAIADEAGRPSFSADGRHLFYLDEFEVGSQSGTLWIYDRGEGSQTRVAERATSWSLAPGGRALAVRQTGGRLALWTWKLTATVIGEQVPQWRFSPDGAYLLAFALGSGEEGPPQLVLWDVDADAGMSLGRAASPLPAFGPDGRSFIYRDARGATHYFQPEGQGSRLLGSQLLQAELSSDGSAVLLRSQELSLRWSLLGGGDEQLVAERVSWASFLPESRSVIYLQSLADGSRHLAIWSAGEGERSLAQALWIDPPSLAPQGGAVWFRSQDESELAWSLWAWDPSEAETVFVASQSKGAPRFSPDGQAVAFVAGDDASLVLWDLETWQGRQLTTGAGPNSPLGWFGGSRRLYYVDGASVLPGIGPLALWDRDTERSVTFGDDVRLESCRFTKPGALLCLARPSPHGEGHELLRWAPDDHLRVLADGVTSFGSDREGARTLFVTRPLVESGDPVLWLFDAEEEEAIPLDDEIDRAILGDGWIAWTVRDTQERRGLYLSFYPREAAALGEAP